MKTTLLITTFNSLSQLVYTYLKDSGYIVDVVYINSISLDSEIKQFCPDIILCPYLVHKVPQNIYEKYPTFIFHPAPIGDRGAYSLENLLLSETKLWGVVILRANEVFDGGDIIVNDEFSILNIQDKTKASIYRNEIKTSYYKVLEKFFYNYKNNISISQIINELNTKPVLSINWTKDTSEQIVKKINTFDSNDGIVDDILGLRVYFYGACIEERLKGNNPKEILAKRDGAICISTINGAIWLSHLKEINKFKLPATYVLKQRLKGVKEDRLPLIFDKSYKTFYEISCDIKDDIAYLSFNFHNGAFRAEQCIRLKYAIEYLKEQVKVIVLLGGDDFFSNGINLNILEDSKKNGEDGWSNINAMNELVKSIIFCENCITISALKNNAGAGGVFLALACDYTIAKEDIVLNPHYKSIGLSGSEYHTYILNKKKVPKDIQNSLLNECLPISAKKAKELNLIDEVYKIDEFKNSLEQFCQNLIKDENIYDDFIWDKEDYLEANQDIIKNYKDEELKIMYNEFWDENSIFHKLRYEFVYKICQSKTPLRLKYYNYE